MKPLGKYQRQAWQAAAADRAPGFLSITPFIGAIRAALGDGSWLLRLMPNPPLDPTAPLPRTEQDNWGRMTDSAELTPALEGRTSRSTRRPHSASQPSAGQRQGVGQA
jgi:hypothetical protein